MPNDSSMIHPSIHPTRIQTNLRARLRATSASVVVGRKLGKAGNGRGRAGWKSTQPSFLQCAFRTECGSLFSLCGVCEYGVQNGAVRLNESEGDSN